MAVSVLLVLALMTAVWSLATGLWYLSPVLYTVGGIIWITHEKQRSFANRSMAYARPWGTTFIFVIWPLRAAVDFLENWKFRNSPERFVVVMDSDIVEFARWDDAVTAAKEEAIATKKRVMVSDQAKFVKQFGTIQHKSWFVEPDGTVTLLPRNFL